MTEITFISNKSKKETSQYFFLFVIAVITWVLQIAVFSRFVFFDVSLDLMLLATSFVGISFGLFPGFLFGIVCSLFSSCILFDHVFYFSYPLVGIISALLVKSLFSDEILFFVLLIATFSFLVEILNGLQYLKIFNLSSFLGYLFISFKSSILNTVISPFFFLGTKFIIKKINNR